MRIVNEKHLSLVWNWDEQERNALTQKYQTHLERLIMAVQERIAAGNPPEVQDLQGLAGELQQAGEMLSQSMMNCFEAAVSIYAMAARGPDEREKRREFVEQVRKHIGKQVVLRQTSVAEIEGKKLILQDVRGIKAILRDDDGLWEALVDFLVLVGPKGQLAEDEKLPADNSKPVNAVKQDAASDDAK